MNRGIIMADLLDQGFSGGEIIEVREEESDAAGAGPSRQGTFEEGGTQRNSQRGCARIAISGSGEDGLGARFEQDGAGNEAEASFDGQVGELAKNIRSIANQRNAAERQEHQERRRSTARIPQAVGD